MAMAMGCSSATHHRFYAPTVQQLRQCQWRHRRRHYHHHFAHPRLLPPLPRKLQLFVVSDMNMNLNLSINAAVAGLAYDSEDEAEGLTTVRFRENPHFMQEVERLLTPEERTILEKNTVPDFDQFTSPKWNPFHTLAASGQILILDDVLKQGIDVNVTNEIRVVVWSGACDDSTLPEEVILVQNGVRMV